MFTKSVFTFLAVVALTFGGAAAGVAGTGGGAGGQHIPGKAEGNHGSGEFCSVNTGDAALSQGEIDSLLFIREEEKVARDSYMVLENLWGLVIFANISESEQAHMDAVKVLVDCYGLTDPVIDEIGTFTNSELQDLFDYLMTEGGKSATDGLYVGALIEETDIVDIQESIDVTSHENIVSTYESIMCGSRNHLRAFIRKIESNGGSYAPQVLEPDVFWAIAYSPVEQDCGDF
jgi:hypothetical protein